jgi:thiamine-monophosphate kinase
MPDMLLPFGDDASAIEIGDGEVAVINVDMLVRKTDVPKKMSLWQAARKAVIMNLSDLAAKGAKPVALLVSVGLPSDLTETDILEIGKGLNTGAREYGTYILGGDTNQAPDLIINCTAIGTCNKNHLMKRSGAKPNDILAVTGFFGKTASGLKILMNNLSAPDLEKPLVESVTMPKARVNEGTALAKSQTATACIDSSDGLAWSLHELSVASNVGFCIDALPVDFNAKKFAGFHGFSSSELALYGGEEYELVVTVDPNLWQTAKKAVESVGGCLIKIGSATEEKKIVLQTGETQVVVDARGWEHFKTELFENKKSSGERL